MSISRTMAPIVSSVATRLCLTPEPNLTPDVAVPAFMPSLILTQPPIMPITAMVWIAPKFAVSIAMHIWDTFSMTALHQPASATASTRQHSTLMPVNRAAVIEQATEQPAWFVYIIEADNGKLYTGITTDIDRRFE